MSPILFNLYINKLAFSMIIINLDYQTDQNDFSFFVLTMYSIALFAM